jgi:deoxyribodipyrimidine photolyase-related protein
MSAFTKELTRRQTDPAGRRWLFVPYDQLTDQIGPLSREDPAEFGIVLVESLWKAHRRPYHKQKLAWVLANMRQFALEQAARGVAVRHVRTDGPYREALEPLIRDLGPLRVMRPAERELRLDLEPLVTAGALDVVPHEGWLTTTAQFEESQGDGPPWKMDAFYRHVRRGSGLLMKGGKPLGGKFSFDSDNRKPWSGEPPAPEPPQYPADPVKQEVGELIERDFARHPGRLDMATVAATRDDVERAWSWATREALPLFGPYEDAMSVRSRTLFHTLLSPLVNLHRLTPARVVRETAALDIPLPSKEGFVRQVLGWREFIRHVHEVSDGFRAVPGDTPVRPAPGDGGWSRSSGMAWQAGPSPESFDGGAAPSALGAHEPLPAAFWGQRSGLACLDTVVRDVWEHGYGHHITRLMVLGNIATLLAIEPRELTDWFWAAYVDAYDWVVEPNVLAMGTFATGPLATTKPYVSGAAYINRMSDYCGGCRFDPASTCPITPLYWAFLARNRDVLQELPRMRLPLASEAKRPRERRHADEMTFEHVRAVLGAGGELDVDLQGQS